MITLDRDLCFLDTETLGLDPDAPIWEFAAIRVNRDGTRDELHFQILHQPGNWLESLPEQFADDYRARFDIQAAIPPALAAKAIAKFTAGAIVLGANPGFDIERLTALLARHKRTPEWHYHPLDIGSMAVGYLARTLLAVRELVDGPVPVWWSSDDLSRRIGVNPDDFARHTALGDVEWCLAQWQAMTHD